MNRAHYRTLLRDVGRSGVYHAPQTGLSELLAAAEEAGFGLFRVDLTDVRDKASLFERLAKALDFPDWFGHNWDALADCLADLSWRQADGYLLLLENCDGFRAEQGSDFAMTLRVLASVSDAWRQLGVPFWVFVDIHADGIAYLPGLA
jgi:hypothetical protein